MSLPTTTCCAAVLNQQQETNKHRCNQLADKGTASSNENKPKYCTVVEDGRVVVKPVMSPPEALGAGESSGESL